MADVATTQLISISKTSLVCSICNGRYKEPKLLLCLHSFCQKCLAEKFKPQTGFSQRRTCIECPICEEETDIPDNNVANLKTNFHLVGLIEDARVQEEVLQNTSQRKALVCEACDQKNRAVSRCLDCSMFLCKHCQTAHRRIPACSQHRVAALDDLTCGKKAQAVKKQQGLAGCSKHPGCRERSGIYCETCKELLCKECVALKLERSGTRNVQDCHPNHQSSRVESAATKKRSAVRQMISQLGNQRLSEFKSAAQSMVTKGSDFDNHTFQLEQQVKRFANKVRVDICAEEASLLQTISKIRRDQAKILDNCGAKMNTAIECMLDATEAAQEIVDSSEDGDFLMLCPLIEKGLESHINMRPEDIFQGLPHWTFDENTLGTLGSLRDSSGYSYGQGSSFADACAQPRQVPFGAFGYSNSCPRKKKYSSYFGGTQHSAQVQPAAVTVKVASEDFMEQLPPPPSRDIGSSQHEESSGNKVKTFELPGNSLQAKKKSFTSTFVTAAKLDPSEMPGPEDDEELMYKQRAHIYHFARKLGIWKERGIGHVKLLRHKDIGALRLVMQLQQESKMVANHSITSDLKLNPLKSSDRSWVWTTTKFKFKTSELANEFKRHLEELQAARKLEEEEERKQPLVWSSFLNTTIREEDEDLMYKQQAAFCCFARHQGVWKVMEKGNGDVKILRLKDSGSLRLIVQHEQDSKICSSHSISAHMTTNLKSSDRLVWRFFDLSPSAGEVSYWYLSVKFKTSELAKEFKRRLEELQAIRKVEEEAAFAKSYQKSFTFGSSKSSDRSGTYSHLQFVAVLFCTIKIKSNNQLGQFYDVHDGDEDDVIFISEKTPTPDQRARAEALLLPPTFFLCEDEPPCPGCRGCDPEDLAARGKSSPTSVKPAAATVSHSQGPVFSTASVQQTFGTIARTTTASVAKKTSTTCDTQEGSQPSSTIFGASGALTVTSFAHIKTDKQGTISEGTSPQIVSSASSGGDLKFGGGKGFKFGSSDGAIKLPFKFGGSLASSSATSLSGALKFGATQPFTAPTTKFMFGGGFQKCDFGGAGDKAAAPLTVVQNPSALTPQKAAVPLTPDKPSLGFIFGAKPATSTQTTTKEETPMVFSFADMAKSKGSTFSFQLDVNKSPEVNNSEKSPIKLRSPDIVSSPGNHIYFEPIVELPECTDLKTGEENETVKFSHRAKLYRFDKDSSQWKERGLGDIKLLFNPANLKYRIVMRREQVLKVCANHYVTPELDLQSNAGPTKSWVWMAMDASEEQVQMEQLAVRFKIEETALEFKKAVDAAKQDIKKEGKEQTTEEKELEIDKEKENNLEIDDGGQATNEEEGEEDQGNNAEMKAFVEQEADVNNDDSKNVDNDCKAGVVHNIVLASASAAVHVTPVKPSAGFVYEDKPATSTQTTTKEETLMGFSFADMAKSKGSTFAFHLDVNKSPEVNNSEKSPIKLRSPDIVSSPGNHIYFEPIVELPECTDLKTGEENETVKFSHRAKLYRFDKDSSQWKERGLGDIKLLYSPANLKYRIVMRREQVLKVCANHYVTPELDLQCYAGSTKSWVWMAMDASEDEVQMEQLAVRFRREETTLEFKKAVDAAKEDIKKEGKEQTKEEAGRNCKQNENIKEEAGGHATKEVDGEEDQDDSGVSNIQDGQEAKGDVDNDDDDEDYEDVDDDDEDYEDIDDEYDDEDDIDDDDDNDEDYEDAEDEYDDEHDVNDDDEDKDEQVQDKDEQVQDKDEHVQDRDEQVENKDEQVKDKTEQVEDKDEQVEDKDEQVKDKDEQVKDKGEQNEDKDDKQVQEISTEGDSDLPIVESCDPNISKAFSELLRSANASHAQKPKVEEATPTSTTDSISKEVDATAAGSKDDSVSEERDDIHFEPVAHLPEQVEKVTGEEDESQLFCSRAKLYRYDKATTQWKDRGIGDIKILHNTQTKKYRIIMRRDQVLRVCANHYITKEMSLAPTGGSENSLVWQAMDAADGDPQMEQLGVRFKLAGTTQRFKAVFEECQAELRKQTQQRCPQTV
ncbi:E3 SUMO-protein ligase RanBP2-like [Patiria miniata]|uniref:E3 SUMO-protein ligase RanBP2 n=1 Tax=Patiria miniata TaxID=46514 RepID=A0A914B558_PATMI|nr:E3 SUMO-protein ligase RanBP2-like [Patiria miniata]